MSVSFSSVLTVSSLVPQDVLDDLKAKFKTVHYYPDGQVPADILQKTEVLLSKALPPTVKSLDDVPNLKFQQLPVAGTNKVYGHPVIAQAHEQGKTPHFQLSTASGTHAISIPQYVVATTLALYLRLPSQILIARNESRWAETEEFADPRIKYDASTSRNESPYTVLNVRGRTAGFLGYGHIGRESARLFEALGAKIIACNSTGKARPDNGYMIPGTGDKDGSIPEAYYNSNEEASLKEFLGKCDILVASLPGTKDTQYFLNKERLSALKPNAVLINVGRGSLVRSQDLLDALDNENGLMGAAIDVTDPEPLTKGHPLFTHPRVIVTPHSSGEAENELAIGADILKANVELLSRNEKPMNLIDWKKAY